MEQGKQGSHRTVEVVVDQHTIQLIREVSGLQSEVKNLADSQKIQWDKVDSIAVLVTTCNHKLDAVVTIQGEVKEIQNAVSESQKNMSDLRKGVQDYKDMKMKIAAIVSALAFLMTAAGNLIFEIAKELLQR